RFVGDSCFGGAAGGVAALPRVGGPDFGLAFGRVGRLVSLRHPSNGAARPPCHIFPVPQSGQELHGADPPFPIGLRQNERPTCPARTPSAGRGQPVRAVSWPRILTGCFDVRRPFLRSW